MSKATIELGPDHDAQDFPDATRLEVISGHLVVRGPAGTRKGVFAPGWVYGIIEPGLSSPDPFVEGRPSVEVAP